MKRALLALLLAFSLPAIGAEWEVAVLFLVPDAIKGFPQDIDENMRELARSTPNDTFHLSVLREFADHRIEYFPDAKSTELHDWGALFFEPPTVKVDIAGRLLVKKAKAPLLRAPDDFADFLSRAFVRPQAKRVLVVYTHGEGFTGTRDLGLRDLLDGEDLTTLFARVPARAGKKPLDVLWFDSCFLASLEAAYELRALADYWVSSEDLEFSSGAPFEALSLFAAGPENVEAAATDMAKRFIDSYATLLAGERKKDVISHSATISIVETKRLDALVRELAAVVKNTAPLSTAAEKALAEHTFVLAKDDLIDLGSALTALPRERTSRATALLELETPGKLTRRKGAKDRVERLRARAENPIVYSGYTTNPTLKGKGYSGLSIASPLGGLPDVNYSDLQFETATRWGTLAD